MGENIGAVARVLLNFGLVSLRLVAPRDRWPNPKAEVVAVGADHVLKAAKVEWTLEDALADATLVIAATARPRGLEKPVWGPREAAAKIRAAIAAGERPVVMFGPEASGMETDEIAKADAILTLPVNPGFASLNLANAVAVFAYAYAEARQARRFALLVQPPDSPPATQEELEAMFAHLEQELEHGRFFTRWTRRR
jgi:tRNA/rRNA methyltransferase